MVLMSKMAAQIIWIRDSEINNKWNEVKKIVYNKHP